MIMNEGLPISRRHIPNNSWREGPGGRETPLLSQEGCPRSSADGVVPVPKSLKAHLSGHGSRTTPSATIKGTGIILDGAATPPNLGGDFAGPQIACSF